jgi:hypothetical protein
MEPTIRKLVNFATIATIKSTQTLSIPPAASMHLIYPSRSSLAVLGNCPGSVLEA